MANKPTKAANTSSKSSSKSPTAKSSAPKKPSQTQKSTSGSANTSPTKRTTKTAASTSSKKSNSSSRKSPRAGGPSKFRQWFTLNRVLDIVGILAVFVGLIVLLSLLSTNNSSFMGSVLSFFRKLFGYGVYLFPFVMLVGGLWLILRSFDRIPPLTVPRALGFLLLFLWLLTTLQFISLTWFQPDMNSAEIAQAGLGGGYFGDFMFSFLQSILGIGGTVIALIAWLLVGLVLALDASVLDLMAWLPASYHRLEVWVLGIYAKFRGSEFNNSEAIPPGEFPVSSNATPRPASAGKPQPSPAFLPQVTLPNSSAPVWILPPIDQVLESGVTTEYDEALDIQRGRLIEETLASFGAPVRVVETNRGPTITQFGVEPDFIETRSGRTRVRVSKISSLANDLALALSARTIRVEAPVPGKGYVGIEVPNDEISLVALRNVIQSEAFERLKPPLRFALGQNVSGQAVAADLAAMPHLLIAGQTGSGKSVCVNALICCFLANNTPDDLRLIMVDPKRVELTGYNGIPHLLAPVVVELERVVSALQWVTREMDMRYRKLAEAGSRNIQDYNAKMITLGQKKLPYLVVIIDELADLMMLAPDETERTITRLAQLARATGIHLVIATQRPSVDVVTGLIKANFPARVAFAVASNVDSRVILDQPGAETLLGRGDMLFQAPDAPAPVRLQGVYVSEAEIFSLVSYWQSVAGSVQPYPVAMEGAPDGLPGGIPLKQMVFWEDGAPDEDTDPLYNEAVDLVRRQGRASISMLQRRLRIGYTRAARLIETMEERGIVGPPDSGTGAREVLDYGPAAPPIDSL